MSDVSDEFSCRIAESPFGQHEALHAAHIATAMFNDHVLEHPAVAERPEIRKLAETALEALYEVYQAIGRANA